MVSLLERPAADVAVAAPPSAYPVVEGLPTVEELVALWPKHEITPLVGQYYLRQLLEITKACLITVMAIDRGLDLCSPSLRPGVVRTQVAETFGLSNQAVDALIVGFDNGSMSVARPDCSCLDCEETRQVKSEAQPYRQLAINVRAHLYNTGVLR